jgi:hypothetical protein
VDQRMIHELILILTKNEDLQQDLWLSYLRGEIDSTFSNKLRQLSLSQKIQQSASDNFQNIINLDIQQNQLDELSELQCLILFMTILGYSLKQVSEYNGIEQTIINKEMMELSKHALWIKHGPKKIFKSRSKIRANRRRN